MSDKILTDNAKTPTVPEVGSAGGKARAKILSPMKRREIARAAAIARWSKAAKSIKS
jgi:hypothetical protein